MSVAAIPNFVAFIQRIGVATIAGMGLDPLRAAMASGECAEVGSIDPLRAPAGHSREQRLRLARTSRLSKLTLLAAWDATDGWSALAAGAGLVLGTAHGAHLSNELFYESLLDEGVEGASPRLFSQTLASTPAAEVSIQLGLTGPTMTLAHGAGAGLGAITLAANMVDAGRARWMLAGAADTLGATLLGALGSGSDRPLAAEGAAFVVLTPDQQEGSLARVAGSGQATGADALSRATEGALKRSGFAEQDLSSIWDFPAERGDAAALQRAVGDCAAAGPLLAACVLLGQRQLPALIRSVDAEAGSVDAVCLR